MTKYDDILKILIELNAKVDMLANRRYVSDMSESSYTLFSWLEKWLAEEHKQNVSESIYEKDLGVIRNHVYSKSEYDKPLSELKLLDLKSLISSVAFSRQRVIAANMLVAALRSAFENDLMAKDITVNFKKPKHEYAEDRALTVKEERKLLRVLRCHPLETYIKVLLYAGLRRNEALGLMRKDLDFKLNEIHIERQVTMSGELTDKLKTKGSKRVIKLFPELRQALLQFSWCKPNVLLFDFKPEYVTKSFTKLCKDSGITDFTLKSLRTTFATRCEERGIPDIIIQSWLGHTSFKTTKAHYVKLNTEFINAEFEKAVSDKKS